MLSIGAHAVGPDAPTLFELEHLTGQELGVAYQQVGTIEGIGWFEITEQAGNLGRHRLALVGQDPRRARRDPLGDPVAARQPSRREPR